MTYDWQVRTGDWVCVAFGAGGPNLIHGEVKHYPQATGECWVVEDAAGTIHYVQQFAEITFQKR